MSMNELNQVGRDLLAVKAMISELEAEAEALTDQIKAAMVDRGEEVILARPRYPLVTTIAHFAMCEAVIPSLQILNRAHFIFSFLVLQIQASRRSGFRPPASCFT